MESGGEMPAFFVFGVPFAAISATWYLLQEIPRGCHEREGDPENKKTEQYGVPFYPSPFKDRRKRTRRVISIQFDCRSLTRESK